MTKFALISQILSWFSPIKKVENDRRLPSETKFSWAGFTRLIIVLFGLYFSAQIFQSDAPVKDKLQQLEQLEEITEQAEDLLSKRHVTPADNPVLMAGWQWQKDKALLMGGKVIAFNPVENRIFKPNLPDRLTPNIPGLVSDVHQLGRRQIVTPTLVAHTNADLLGWVNHGSA